jgi:hypothetical protein
MCIHMNEIASPALPESGVSEFAMTVRKKDIRATNMLTPVTGIL